MVNLIIGVVFVAALFIAFGLARSKTACDGKCEGCEVDCKFRLPRQTNPGEVRRG